MRTVDKEAYMKDEILRMIQESDDLAWRDASTSKEEAMTDEAIDAVYGYFIKDRNGDTLEQFTMSFFGL